MPNCRECLHDEMCFSTHTGDSPACCDFLDAARYHDIMQAEREGRVVILPCRVGDTLFMLKDGSIYDGTVRFLRWEHHKDRGVRSDVAANPNPYFSIGASFDDFGKTVFLSREEAEKALEEGTE